MEYDNDRERLGIFQEFSRNILEVREMSNRLYIILAAWTMYPFSLEIFDIIVWNAKRQRAMSRIHESYIFTYTYSVCIFSKHAL